MITLENVFSELGLRLVALTVRIRLFDGIGIYNKTI